MNVILNEKEWVEDTLREKTVGRSPTETATLLAKYYYQKGKTKREVARCIEEFLRSSDYNGTEGGIDIIVERAVKRGKNCPLVMLDGVDVYDGEMKSIEKVGGRQARRLAFTLLCLAKFQNAVNKDSNFWVSIPDGEIARMANIKTSIRRQCAMYSQLRDAGLITFSKQIDNTNVRVDFAEDGGDVAVRVTDFRNLGYQYMMYLGEPYYVCKHCGITVKKEHPSSDNHVKYCKDCAGTVWMQQHVNIVERKRVQKMVCVF